MKNVHFENVNSLFGLIKLPVFCEQINVQPRKLNNVKYQNKRIV